MFLYWANFQRDQKLTTWRNLPSFLLTIKFRFFWPCFCSGQTFNVVRNLQREEIYTHFCWPFNVRRSKSHQVNKMRSKWEGICIKCILYYFFLPIFLLIWEDKKNGSRRKNFLPYFLSFLFSFLKQTVENNIFHPIFLSLFSIIFVFTPTKNTLKVLGEI